MRNRTAFGLFILLLGMLAGAPRAEAGLRVCNQDKIKYRVAVGYVDQQKRWLARGWRSLEPGECKDLLGFRLDNRFYYYFARGHDENNSRVKITGENAFCIESRNFQIYQTDYGKSTPEECAKDGYRSEKFKKVDVQGKPEFTINLGGPDNPPTAGNDPAPTPAPAQTPVANTPPPATPPPTRPSVAPVQPSPGRQQPSPPVVQQPSAPTASSDDPVPRPRRPRVVPQDDPSPNAPPEKPAAQQGGQTGGSACQRFPNLC